MKKLYTSIIFIVLLIIFNSCSTPNYFHDDTSYKRQKELKSDRATNVSGDILSGLFAISSSVIFNTEPQWSPPSQNLKKLKLNNPSSDTIYVNMLTDLEWDKDHYCDFMDIRIPPKTTCKILVPIEALYNLYFSNTPESEDDELMEIFTSDVSTLNLIPGITAFSDTIDFQ